jgi:hypothetical protein
VPEPAHPAFLMRTSRSIITVFSSGRIERGVGVSDSVRVSLTSHTR